MTFTADDGWCMDRTAGFDDWYRATRPTLVRSLLVASGGDLEAATEAADEAMVRALERWPRVRRMDSPGGWAHRTGLNVLRRRFRRGATERRATDRATAGRPMTTTDDPSTAVALWEAVALLDRRSREVIALRYVGQLTEPEIAELLGVRTGTVSSLLSRARTRLRSLLDEPDERDREEGPS
jgi:RNA polymerase sigma-70 factor (ECF subfamily)